MKAKDYLRQVKKLDKLIKNKQYEVMQWRSLATGTTVQLSERVQSSGSKQRMADTINVYVDIEAEIKADIERYIKLKAEIIKTIEQLPEQEYDLLHKVYIQQKTLYEALEGDKSYSTITTLHGRALDHLQAILDNK